MLSLSQELLPATSQAPAGGQAASSLTGTNPSDRPFARPPARDGKQGQARAYVHVHHTPVVVFLCRPPSLHASLSLC